MMIAVVPHVEEGRVVHPSMTVPGVSGLQRFETSVCFVSAKKAIMGDIVEALQKGDCDDRYAYDEDDRSIAE